MNLAVQNKAEDKEKEDVHKKNFTDNISSVAGVTYEAIFLTVEDRENKC